MRSSHSQHKHRFGARRHFAVWVCALVLLVQGLMPVIASSAMAATDAPAGFDEFNYICTVNGIQPLVQAQEQDGSSQPAQGSGQGYCPLCQIHSVDLAITQPATAAVSAPHVVDGTQASAYQDVARNARPDRPALPRAPPANS